MVAFTQTVLDNFNDNSINVALWNAWGGANVVESTAQLKTSTASPAAANFYGIDWVGTAIDVDEKFVGVKVVSVGSTGNAVEMYPVIAVVNGTNSFYWFLNRQSGNASCWTKVGGVTTQRGSTLVGTPANRWYVVGETGGNIKWYYSDDGVNFTEQASQSNPYGTTALATVTMQSGKAGGGATGVFTMTMDDFATYVTAVTAFSGTGLADLTVNVSSTGLKNALGTGLTTVTPAMTSSGIKNAIGTGLITITADINGVGGSGANVKSGTGLIDLSVNVMGTGFGGRIGTGLITIAPDIAGSGSGNIQEYYVLSPAQPTGALARHETGVAGLLLRFYGFNESLALVKRNGVWSTARAVNQDTDDEYYQGGMRHVISGVKAAEITAAGFGAYLTPIGSD